MTVSSSFEAYLQANPQVATQLQQNKELSKAVLTRPALQHQLERGELTLEQITARYLPQHRTEKSAIAGPATGKVSDVAQQMLRQAASADTNQRARAAREIDEVTQRLPEGSEQANIDLVYVTALLEQLQVYPQALSALQGDSQLMAEIVEKQLRLEDILKRLGIDAQPAVAAAENMPPSVAEVAEMVNLNAIPTALDMQLDAKGWPKYLNVPAACPPPAPDVFYYHNHVVHVHSINLDFNQQPHGGNALNSLFKPFSRTGITFNYVMSDVEAYAVPFATRNEAGARLSLGIEASPPSVYKAGAAWLQTSFAYCPGDFSGITPAGKPELHERCRRTPIMGAGSIASATVHHPENLPHVSNDVRDGCVLTPGTQYFFNVRPFAQDPVLALEKPSASCQAQYEARAGHRAEQTHKPTRLINGVEHPVCARLAVFGGTAYQADPTGGVQAPYAAACIDGPLYPINYQKRPGIGYLCGESHKFSAPCNANYLFQGWKCYDPYNKMPPQHFVRECTNSDTLVWTQGYNRPAYAHYRCEAFANREAYQNNSPGALSSRAVCAAHRENQVRTISCSTTSRNRVVDSLEQCQFDESLGRFEWLLVSSKVANRQTHASYYDVCKRSSAREAPAHQNTCSWNGETYPLGTVMTQTFEGTTSVAAQRAIKGTHRYVCEQRAPVPALPRFAHVETGLDPTHERHIGGCVTCGSYSVSFEQP